MSGEYKNYDEQFVLSDGAAPQPYAFMLAPRGALSNVSGSPFAPKSTVGDRSYADYDAISAIGLSDFSGGQGQEKLKDTTMYYGGSNVDTRGGSIVLGPRVRSYGAVNLAVNANGTSYVPVGNNIEIPAAKVAARLTSTTSKLRGAWLFLKASDGIGAVTVAVYRGGFYPETTVATASIPAGTLKADGKWVWVPFASPVQMTTDAIYWIGVENDSANKVLYWLADPHVVNTVLPPNSARWVGGAWQGYYKTLAVYACAYESNPDAPPAPFVGSGLDRIARVWATAGRSLWYVGATADLTPVPATYGGATQVLAADIVDHAWYRSPSDTAPWLYLALGDDTDMQKFNGSLAQPQEGHPETGLQWAAVTGRKARCLCTHDNLLAYAYARNKVDLTNGTVWGTTSEGGPGNEMSVEVGDASYPVRHLISWGGAVWAGKDDGLFKITVPTGYPITGTLTCQRVLDLLPVAQDTNFQLMLVHQGDLWFGIGHGIMRYTSTGVLTAMAPDTALNVQASQRLTFKAGVSVLGTLWLLAEGAVSQARVSEAATAEQAVSVGDSVLYCYTEGHWYPVHTFAGVDELPVAGIAVEPGWYGEQPRLWFTTGWGVGFCDMPTTTLRRWLVEGLQYADTGYLLTSWADGGLATVEKDWMKVELVLSQVGEVDPSAPDPVEVWWRPDERVRPDDTTAWASLGRVQATDGNVELPFPAGSHSTKCQLKVQLWSTGTFGAPYGSTPRVQVLVLKYMERPDDVRNYTRTYRLADRLEDRNGVLVKRSLAQQVDDLRTLRQAKEPLTLRLWYGPTRQVHITDYSISELPNEMRESGDRGEMLAIVRVQEV